MESGFNVNHSKAFVRLIRNRGILAALPLEGKIQMSKFFMTHPDLRVNLHFLRLRRSLHKLAREGMVCLLESCTCQEFEEVVESVGGYESLRRKMTGWLGLTGRSAMWRLQSVRSLHSKRDALLYLELDYLSVRRLHSHEPDALLYLEPDYSYGVVPYVSPEPGHVLIELDSKLKKRLVCGVYISNKYVPFFFALGYTVFCFFLWITFITVTTVSVLNQDVTEDIIIRIILEQIIANMTFHIIGEATLNFSANNSTQYNASAMERFVTEALLGETLENISDLVAEAQEQNKRHAVAGSNGSQTESNEDPTGVKRGSNGGPTSITGIHRDSTGFQKAHWRHPDTHPGRTHPRTCRRTDCPVNWGRRVDAFRFLGGSIATDPGPKHPAIHKLAKPGSITPRMSWPSQIVTKPGSITPRMLWPSQIVTKPGFITPRMSRPRQIMAKPDCNPSWVSCHLSPRLGLIYTSGIMGHGPAHHGRCTCVTAGAAPHPDGTVGHGPAHHDRRTRVAVGAAPHPGGTVGHGPAHHDRRTRVAMGAAPHPDGAVGHGSAHHDRRTRAAVGVAPHPDDKRTPVAVGTAPRPEKITGSDPPHAHYRQLSLTKRGALLALSLAPLQVAWPWGEAGAGTVESAVSVSSTADSALLQPLADLPMLRLKIPQGSVGPDYMAMEVTVGGKGPYDFIGD
eukprot:gene26401-17498_t